MENPADHMRIVDLVNTYSDTVMRIAYHSTGNIHDAEDITQEVFLSLMKHNLRELDDEHLKAYIIRACINQCRKLHRTKIRHAEVPLEDAQPVFTMEERAVMEAVEQLPDRYRQVIYLYYIEGYKVPEIAAILKRPKGTVTSQLQRGREQLRESLGEEYDV